MKTIKVIDLSLSMRGQKVYGKTYPNKNKTARPSRRGFIKLDEIHIYSNGNIKTGSAYLRADDDLLVFEDREEFKTHVKKEWKAYNQRRNEEGRLPMAWSTYVNRVHPELEE